MSIENVVTAPVISGGKKTFVCVKFSNVMSCATGVDLVARNM
jgi:hypothetical protein